MINTKFTIITKDNNCIENLNTIEECFKHDVLKLYEATFGKRQLLIAFDADRKEYIFNFLKGYFSLEALQQLQEYEKNNNIMYKYHNELMAHEIAILKGEKCYALIGELKKTKRKYVYVNSRKKEETTLKDFLKGYRYFNATELSFEIGSQDELYFKAVLLSKKKNEITSPDFKWLDYIQQIEY